MKSRQTAENAPDLQVGTMSSVGWLRPIIEILDTGPQTVDDVARELGDRFPTDEEVPVDDYLSFLVGEGLAMEADSPQHYELTKAGENAMEGSIAPPAS